MIMAMMAVTIEQGTGKKRNKKSKRFPFNRLALLSDSKHRRQ
jgi:hypothetical protein